MARSRRRPARSPGKLLGDVRRELKKGWPPGLTLLTGDDLYHLDAAQRALLAALVPEESSDFALTVYGEQKVDVATVVAGARSVGMFSPRRVVLVRSLEALEGDPDALTAYASDPPPSSYLLVRAPALDRRRKLHQALDKSGRTLEFSSAAFDLGEVATIGKQKGLTLDRRAAAFLAEVCGGDFYRIDGELEKLRSWLGDAASERLTAERLREVTAGSGLLSGWEIADAILQRDRPAALAALRHLLESGDVPLRMLGGLAYRTRGMLQAKAMMARGAGSSEALRAAGLWGQPYDTMARGLARYSLAELSTFPAHLLEADRSLKSRAIDPGAVLETLIRNLTSAGPRPAGAAP